MYFLIRRRLLNRDNNQFGEHPLIKNEVCFCVFWSILIRQCCICLPKAVYCCIFAPIDVYGCLFVLVAVYDCVFAAMSVYQIYIYPYGCLRLYMAVCRTCMAECDCLRS